MSMREVLAYSLLSHETKPASAYSPILSSVFHFKRLMKNAFRWTSFAQYRLSARRRSLSILTCKRTQAVCCLWPCLSGKLYSFGTLPHFTCVCLLIFRSGQQRPENFITDKLEAILPD